VCSFWTATSVPAPLLDDRLATAAAVRSQHFTARPRCSASRSSLNFVVGNTNQICHRLAETHPVGQMLILSAETLPPQYFYVHIWATHEWWLSPADCRGTLSGMRLREVQTVTVGD